MAVKELKALTSSLTAFPTTVAAADTIKNSTNGLVTICKGKEVVSGGTKVVLPVDGSEETIAIGASSAAVTLAAGEKVYILNGDGSMSSTIDKFIV